MRHILVLNRMPQTMANYAEWFKGHDIEWTMLGWDAIADSYIDHSNAIFYKHYACDKIFKDAYDLCKKNCPSAIITTSEFDVVRMSQLRDTFGIAGQSAANAKLFRDKIAMKHKVQQAGLSVPAFSLARSALDVVRFIEKHGYPVIIKPVNGAGTVNVNLIRNPQELAEFLDKNVVENLDIETFVIGRMYAVDGLIYQGTPKVMWPHAYNSGSTLGFNTGQLMGSYMLDVNNPLTSRLIQFTRDVLTALDAPPLVAFHCEIFHTPQDELVLCEIACRLGGGRIVPMLNTAFGVDLYEYWVKAQAGIPLEIKALSEPQQMAGQLLYMPKVGVYRGPIEFKSLHWVNELIINVKPGHRYDASSSVDFAASAVVTGTSEHEVKAKLADVVAVFDSQMKWDCDTRSDTEKLSPVTAIA